MPAWSWAIYHSFELLGDTLIEKIVATILLDWHLPCRRTPSWPKFPRNLPTLPSYDPAMHLRLVMVTRTSRASSLARLPCRFPWPLLSPRFTLCLYHHLITTTLYTAAHSPTGIASTTPPTLSNPSTSNAPLEYGIDHWGERNSCRTLLACYCSWTSFKEETGP
ncbi:hypothetical protein CPC08DRAFT_717368 [Agrocybe pediades]|nr:hypothetical protein CPC08DRAFT_717368 [Agrocybe pediades]